MFEKYKQANEYIKNNIKRVSEIEVNEWNVRIIIDNTLIVIYFDDSDIEFADILVNGIILKEKL